MCEHLGIRAGENRGSKYTYDGLMPLGLKEIIKTRALGVIFQTLF